MEEEWIFSSSDQALQIICTIPESGVIYTQTEGHMSLRAAQESQADFEHFLTKRYEKQEGKYPAFIVSDLSKLRGADLRARFFLLKRVGKLFREHTIAHAAIINPNPFIVTIGKIWTRILPVLNQSYHPSLQHALADIEKKKQQLNDHPVPPDDPFDYGKWLNRQKVTINGRICDILTKSEWHYDDKAHGIRIGYFILNKQVVFSHAEGNLGIKHIEVSHRILQSVMESLATQGTLTSVISAKKVRHVPLPIRRRVLKIQLEYGKYFDRQFLVLPDKLNQLFKLLRLALPQLSAIRSINSVDDALREALSSREERNPESGWRRSELELKRMKRQDLIRLIRNMEEQTDQYSRHMLDIFGRISWDQEFTASPLEVPKEEPYASLIDTFNLLQSDLTEIIDEFRNLNSRLEREVEIRTADLNGKNQELTKVNHELDQFVYRVSHDLRAPLSSIAGLVQIIQNEKDQKQKDEYINLIPQNIHKLDNFIAEIIQISRNSRQELNNDHIDLADLVQDIELELSHMQDVSRIDFQVSIEDGLHFHSDRSRFKVVLINLISNAFKYNLSAYRDAFVRVVFKTKGKDLLVLTVEDNGQGIPPEHLEKVTQMFYRATVKAPGTGLGLYIVKETLDKLGGQLKIESQVDKGSTFQVTIPTMETNPCTPPRMLPN